MTWRDRLRPRIAALLADARARGLDAKTTRKWLACPKSLRNYYPGKVWRDEVARALKGRVGPYTDRARKRMRAREQTPTLPGLS